MFLIKETEKEGNVEKRRTGKAEEKEKTLTKRENSSACHRAVNMG